MVELAPSARPAARLAAKPSRLDDAAFWLFRTLFGGLLRLVFRIRVEGPLPPPGACVLAANHRSLLDPLLLGAAVPRRVVYLMTEVVWRSRWLGWFYRWNRALPLAARGGNREPMRAARLVLQQGRTIGIFPEGGLSRDGLPMLGMPGAVSLVVNEGVPIVPVGIVGAGDVLPPGAGWPRFRRVTVRFGAPITVDELAALGGDRRDRLRVATKLVMQRIAALTGQEAREDTLASPAAAE
jgi:1-acyl-sn-glycerol-3-phosphate acyltransferase